MEINNKLEFLDRCRGIVMNCDVQIIIIEIMGGYRAFLTNAGVHLKTRECRYNEVQDAQDITTLVLNTGINFNLGMTHQALLEKVQSIPKENFKFGTDNYLWITKVDLNR